MARSSVNTVIFRTYSVPLCQRLISWISRVQPAKHRAVFDAPTPGIVLDLAACHIDNVRPVYGRNTGDICAVLNIRTRAVSMALADNIWQKYALGDDAKVNDPVTAHRPAATSISAFRTPTR